MLCAMLSHVASALVVFLTFCLIVDTNNYYKVNSYSSVVLALKSDVKQCLSHGKIAGLSCKYSTTSKVLPSWKLRAGLQFVNITMMASLLVLLAGDVSSNPGPTYTNAGKLLGKHGFRFAHLNAHSIVNKMDEIRLRPRDNPFQVFAVSEAWLNSSILDSEVSVPGYTLVRNNRKVKQGVVR